VKARFDLSKERTQQRNFAGTVTDFEVPTQGNFLKMTAFWDVVPCSLVKVESCNFSAIIIITPKKPLVLLFRKQSWWCTAVKVSLCSVDNLCIIALPATPADGFRCSLCFQTAVSRNRPVPTIF
jgi:hypothetical protein